MNDFNLKMKADSRCNVPFGLRYWNTSGHHLVDAVGVISDDMDIGVMKMNEQLASYPNTQCSYDDVCTRQNTDPNAYDCFSMKNVR